MGDHDTTVLSIPAGALSVVMQPQLITGRDDVSLEHSFQELYQNQLRKYNLLRAEHNRVLESTSQLMEHMNHAQVSAEEFTILYTANLKDQMSYLMYGPPNYAKAAVDTARSLGLISDDLPTWAKAENDAEKPASQDESDLSAGNASETGKT
jgi:hypothetical protein